MKNKKQRYEEAVGIIRMIESFNRKKSRTNNKIGKEVFNVSQNSTDFESVPNTKKKAIISSKASPGVNQKGESNIFTFNELMTKIDNQKLDNFKPWKISLRKIDAKKRKILEDYEFQVKPTTNVIREPRIQRAEHDSDREVENINKPLSSVPTSMNFMLSDKEKQEAYINQEGYQDMLDEIMATGYRPTQEMMETMKYYQKSFHKDLFKLRKDQKRQK